MTISELDRARLAAHRRIVHAIGARTATAAVDRLFGESESDPERHDAESLRAAWVDHVAAIAAGRIEGEVAVEAQVPVGDPAAVSARLHGDIAFFSAAMPGFAMEAGSLAGAGLAAWDPASRERVTRHLELAFAWRREARWNWEAGPGGGSSDGASGAPLHSSGVPWKSRRSVLAIGPGAIGRIRNRWRYELPDLGFHPPGDARTVKAWPLRPEREERRKAAEALVRGEGVSDGGPTSPLCGVFEILRGLGLAERRGEVWVLEPSSEEERASAALFLADDDRLDTAWREAGIPGRYPSRRPPTDQRRLEVSLGSHSASIVLRPAWPGHDNAAVFGDFAFYYPMSGADGSIGAARRRLLQLCREVLEAVERRYRPRDLDDFAERFVEAFRFVGKDRQGVGGTVLARVEAEPPSASVPVGPPPPPPTPVWSRRGVPRSTPRAVKSSLILRVSNRCNLKCAFCLEHLDRIGEEPSLEAFVVALRALDPLDFANVMFMGAETLLRPDAIELIAATRDLGFSNIALATNGTTLRGEEQLDALIAAGLAGVELSVHTLDASRAAHLSGRSFTAPRQNRVLALLEERCREGRFGCMVNIVLNAANVGDVRDLVESIEERWPGLRPEYALKFPRDVAAFTAGLGPPPLAALRERNLPAALRGAVSGRFRFYDAPLCVLDGDYASSGNLVAWATGSVCLTLDWDTGILEGNEHPLGGLRTTYSPACASCAVRALCPGVEPAYLEATGSEHGCRPIADAPNAVLAQVVEATRGSSERGHRLADAGLENVVATAKELSRIRGTENRWELSRAGGEGDATPEGD